jgi:uncharacterized membrane protein AbrB (regulator of aidB expression)
MLDAAAVLGEIFNLLGGFAAFLGIYGAAMLVITLLLSSFVQALSPFSRRANFLFCVVVVTGLALWQSYSAGRIEDNLPRLIPYLIVVMVPVLLSVVLEGFRRRRETREPFGGIGDRNW